MSLDELLREYELGPERLRAVVAKAARSSWKLRPISGKWSIHEVVCHLADFEPIGVDRMKRVLVEDNPTLFGADPDAFALGLHSDARDLEEELDVISSLRKHMARILRQTDVEDFQRTGVHTEDGPLTLESLLERSMRHIPHHIVFIEQKIAAM